MRQSISFGTILFFILISFTSCAFINVKMPYDTDLDKTVLGDKVGKSYYQSILGLVAWGDGGTKAAAEDGNISIVNHMDKEILCVLFGVYYKETTLVYGE
ncbi:MAG: hypothetical protein GY864_07125 [Desulfobacterales bacterium]|nr:hypothetical protein [Desulfobacterales bacterium]